MAPPRRGRKRGVEAEAENVGPDGTCTTGSAAAAKEGQAAAVVAAAQQEQTFDASYVEEMLKDISAEGKGASFVDDALPVATASALSYVELIIPHGGNDPSAPLVSSWRVR